MLADWCQIMENQPSKEENLSIPPQPAMTRQKYSYDNLTHPAKST
jgi:hypothetical protein